jgi:hypothetical protein
MPNERVADKGFFALWTADSGHPYPGANRELPAGIVEEFQREPRPAREFPRTDVVPHLRVPLVSGRNQALRGGKGEGGDERDARDV